ncbi:hypothetical protein HN814_05585, partial [Candidatus Woesearchaeota archaeon]|nr:hypothetical protein [Candidatus Woesearchaeota archaeon]
MTEEKKPNKSQNLEKLIAKFEEYKKKYSTQISADELNILANEFKRAGDEDKFVNTLMYAIAIGQHNTKTFLDLDMYYAMNKQYYSAMSILSMGIERGHNNQHLNKSLKGYSELYYDNLNDLNKIKQRTYVSDHYTGKLIESFKLLSKQFHSFRDKKSQRELLEIAISCGKADANMYLDLFEILKIQMKNPDNKVKIDYVGNILQHAKENNITNDELEKIYEEYQTKANKTIELFVLTRHHWTNNLKKEELYALGQNLKEIGYYYEMLQIYSLGIESNNTNPQMLSELINFHRKKNETDIIIEVLTKGLNLNSLDDKLYSELILELIKKEDYDAIDQHLEKPTDKLNLSSKAYRPIIYYLLENEQINRAINLSNSNPLCKDSIILGEIGHGLIQKKQFKEAEQKILEGIKLDETNYMNYIYLSELHELAGNKENAKIILEQSLEKVKTKEPASLLLSVYYSKEGNAKKAIDLLEKERNKLTLSPEGFRILSFCYTLEKEHDNAIDVVEHAIRLGKINEKLIDRLPIYYRNAGRLKDVISFMQSRIPDHKTQPEFFLKLANIYLETGYMQPKIKKIQDEHELYELSIGNYNITFEKDKATSILDDLIKKSKGISDSYNLLIKLFYDKQLYDTTNSLDKLIQDKTKDWISLVKLAQDKVMSGNNDFTIIKKEDKNKQDDIIHPHFKKVEDYYGMRIGKKTLEEISELYESALKYDDVEDIVYELLSSCYYELNKKDDLIRILNEGIKKNKLCAENKVILGLISEDINQIKEVIEICKDENNTDYSAYTALANISSKKPKLKKELKLGTENHYINLLVKQLKKNKDLKQSLFEFKKASNKLNIIANMEKLVENRSLLSITEYLVIKEAKIENKYDSNKKISNLEKFEKEKIIKKTLEKIVKTKAQIPSYYDHFEEDGHTYYITRLCQGYTFSEAINIGWLNEKNYKKVLDLIATIHVKTPLELLSDYNLEDKLDKRISKKDIDPEFKSYCKPVVEVLKNSKNICYNKDSTTENWMITPDETIVLIDTEDKGIVPYALDLASFLNLDEPFVDFEERFDYVQLYIDTVNNI